MKKFFFILFFLLFNIISLFSTNLQKQKNIGQQQIIIKKPKMQKFVSIVRWLQIQNNIKSQIILNQETNLEIKKMQIQNLEKITNNDSLRIKNLQNLIDNQKKMLQNCKSNKYNNLLYILTFAAGIGTTILIYGVK